MAITMKDIAQAAGVHQTTVSLALRDDSRLPSKTRKRIQRLARKMGYKPNPLVSALISQRKRKKPSRFASTIAFLTAYRTHSGWKVSAPP